MVLYHFLKAGMKTSLDDVEREYMKCIDEPPVYAMLFASGTRSMQFEMLCYYGIICTAHGLFDEAKFMQLYVDIPESKRQIDLNFLRGEYIFESWRAS